MLNLCEIFNDVSLNVEWGSFYVMRIIKSEGDVSSSYFRLERICFTPSCGMHGSRFQILSLIG